MYYFNDCNLMIMFVYYCFCDNDFIGSNNGNLVLGVEIWDQFRFFVEVGYI